MENENLNLSLCYCEKEKKFRIELNHGKWRTVSLYEICYGEFPDEQGVSHYVL